MTLDIIIIVFLMVAAIGLIIAEVFLLPGITIAGIAGIQALTGTTVRPLSDAEGPIIDLTGPDQLRAARDGADAPSAG